MRNCTYVIYYLVVMLHYYFNTWYTARARANRAFCPPLKVNPPSPIKVKSPLGYSFRS